MKRIATILLAVVMLAAVLAFAVSCNGSKTDVTTAKEAVDTTEEVFEYDENSLNLSNQNSIVDKDEDVANMSEEKQNKIKEFVTNKLKKEMEKKNNGNKENEKEES